MTFDLVVTISMHFYERCQTKRDVCEISDLRRREILLLRSVCLFVSQGGGGGLILIYFNTYVGLGIFFWFKILNFNIFWGFQKTEYFWGYEDFVDIFCRSSQNWTLYRGHFYSFKCQIFIQGA